MQGQQYDEQHEHVITNGNVALTHIPQQTGESISSLSPLPPKRHVAHSLQDRV